VVLLLVLAGRAVAAVLVGYVTVALSALVPVGPPVIGLVRPLRTRPATGHPSRHAAYLLSRRRPSSLASNALEYWVRVTASGSPVILWDETDGLLRNVRISIAQTM
jgi:hypothetical protein